MGTLSIRAQGFNNYLISKVFTNFVNVRWSIFIQVYNSLTVHDNLWILKFDNFYEFQNVISDALRTKIDMWLTPNSCIKKHVKRHVPLWIPATLLKRDSNTNVFLWMLRNFWEHLFWRTSSLISYSPSP